MSGEKWGLIRNSFTKNRRWEVDNLDYNEGYLWWLKQQAKCGKPKLEAEANEALEWLDKFNREYYNNSGLKKKDALHNTDELRKDCYNRTNAAHRDILGMWSIYFDGIEDVDSECLFDRNDKTGKLDCLEDEEIDELLRKFN